MSRNEYTCGISGKRFIDIDAWRSCRDAHDCQHDCPYERNRVEIPRNKSKSDGIPRKAMTQYEFERLGLNKSSGCSWVAYIFIALIVIAIITGIVYGIFWLVNR
jgi:hypothetical protein